MSFSADWALGAALWLADATDSPRSRFLASIYEARSPSTGLGATTGGGCSTGGGVGAIVTSDSCLLSAMTGGAGRCFAAVRGGAARGGGDACANVGDCDDGDGGVARELGLGSSSTARALLALPSSAFAADKSCIRGSQTHSAAMWTSSDSANASQTSGIVTTSCRLLRS